MNRPASRVWRKNVSVCATSRTVCEDSSTSEIGKALRSLKTKLSVMSGPKSISAEHDYLVEQIEDLKRRLLNETANMNPYEGGSAACTTIVFERDERLAQMTLTMTDLEAALQDRTAELRDLEARAADAEGEVERQRRGERTREVVGKAFSDTLGLVRGHDQREAARAAYADAPDVERRIAAPTVEDMERLAEGGEIDLNMDVEAVPVGEAVDRPASCTGGKGDPVIYDEDWVTIRSARRPRLASKPSCLPFLRSASRSRPSLLPPRPRGARQRRHEGLLRPSRSDPPRFVRLESTRDSPAFRHLNPPQDRGDEIHTSRPSRHSPWTRSGSSARTKSALPTRPTSPPGAMTR